MLERNVLDLGTDCSELLLEGCDKLGGGAGGQELEDDDAAVVLGVVETESRLDGGAVLGQDLLDCQRLLAAVRHVDCNQVVRHVECFVS